MPYAQLHPASGTSLLITHYSFMIWQNVVCHYFMRLTLLLTHKIHDFSSLFYLLNYYSPDILLAALSLYIPLLQFPSKFLSLVFCLHVSFSLFFSNYIVLGKPFIFISPKFIFYIFLSVPYFSNCTLNIITRILCCLLISNIRSNVRLIINNDFHHK